MSTALKSNLAALHAQRLTAYRRGLTLDEIKKLDLRIKALHKELTESEKAFTFSLDVQGHLIGSSINSLPFLDAISRDDTESFLYISRAGHTLSIYISPGEKIKHAIEQSVEELRDVTLCFDTPEEEEIAREALPLCLERLSATA
jgi:hypothetical protein